MADVRVFPSPAALTQAAANLVLASAEEAVRERGRFVWGLSGGSTPEALYRRLAGPPFASAMPWRATIVFWGDERWVPHDHANSNQRMANEALLARGPAARTDAIPVPTENVSPDESAAAVEDALRRAIGDAPVRPDLLLLGIGPDGHTASLFPGTSALDERERLFTANRVPQMDAWRITATLPLINASRHVVFLAQGQDKAEAVQLALDPADGAPPLPAALVAPEGGSLTWLLDRHAASGLTGGI
ncbi:MAG: 6-phosphogluconolactonase [Chloroflexota bacterium]|nr:6-phosphogluconolactonase [Chloroflexota bacterium]MDE2885772.1 6-phosphogluconolactonase [Chloroflexota bacterium]